MEEREVVSEVRGVWRDKGYEPSVIMRKGRIGLER
jgi:hypothetical protein